MAFKKKVALLCFCLLISVSALADSAGWVREKWTDDIDLISKSVSDGNGMTVRCIISDMHTEKKLGVVFRMTTNELIDGRMSEVFVRQDYYVRTSAESTVYVMLGSEQWTYVTKSEPWINLETGAVIGTRTVMRKIELTPRSENMYKKYCAPHHSLLADSLRKRLPN